MPDSLLRDTVARCFADTIDSAAVRRGAIAWSDEIWRAVCGLGLPLALAPAECGGSELSAIEGAAAIELTGYYAAPVPLGETMLAAALLRRVGLEVPDGPLSIAPPDHTELTLRRTDDGWGVSGRASHVPWARHAKAVLLEAIWQSQTMLVRLPTSGLQIRPAANLAGEPRDDVAFDIELPSGAAVVGVHDLQATGAALRTMSMAGAAQRICAMSIAFAKDREQFGRPIASFQTIQQNLAQLAEQAAICQACSGLAAATIFLPGAAQGAAIAKARCGEAAALAADLAHQIHGAIGFSEEYDLQLLTRRVWAWRDEFGNEAEWALTTGRDAVAAAAGPWPFICGVTEECAA